MATLRETFRRSGQWLIVGTLLLGGCATIQEEAATRAAEPPATEGIEPDVVSFPEPRDPLIAFNRAVFAFNDVTYRYLLIPAARGYVWATPEPVRASIGNFFYNLATPIYLVNHLLQLEPEPAGRNLLRFGVNTTAGVLGLFDPAEAWFGLERAETRFEDTLTEYGAGYGVYLVLPILGPSDLRNSLSEVADYLLDPIPHLLDSPESSAVQGFNYFQDFAPQAERYLPLRRESDDPYTFFRNLYLQGVQRDAAYNNKDN